MTHSTVEEYLHVVWSTRDRESFISGDIQDQVIRYLGAIVRNQGSRLVEGAVLSDHVHMLLALNPTCSLSTLMRKVKVSTSSWLKAKASQPFKWGSGYCAFSVSPGLLDRCQRFLRKQMEFHHSRSYSDELRLLVDKHEIDYQEEYLLTNSHTRRLVHAVWGTKGRESWIDESFGETLKQVFETIAKEKGATLIEAGGYFDHVHLLLEVPAKLSLSEVVQGFKSLSTRKLGLLSPEAPLRTWQEGYGAFSVSFSTMDVVQRYIQNQCEHHRAKNWDQEIQTLRVCGCC